MGVIADRVRGALGRQAQEPPPEGPPPRNLKTEYLSRWREFLALPYPMSAGPAAAIRALRAEAIDAGLGEALDRIWLGEPEYRNFDPGYRAWLVAKLNHFEGRGPDPGERPPKPPPADDFRAWEQPWRDVCWRLCQACKSGVGVAAAEEKFLAARRAIAEKTGRLDEMARRCIELPQTNVAADLDAWWAEAGYRWQHAEHGGHWPVRRPIARPFVLMSELQANEEAKRSGVVLIAEHDGKPAGTWLRLDPATSHQLVEEKKAPWARDCPIPDDPRPPLDVQPGEDWTELEALRPIRLTSRHRLECGEHRLVAPDEANALIRAGAAREYIEPPPEPPKPRPNVTFE